MNLIKFLSSEIEKILNKLGYNDNVVLNVSNRPELGDYQYNGCMKLAGHYKKKPVDFKAANKRFYSLYIPNYNAECGILPDNYKSYERMKGVTNEDNIALIAFDLKL
jgi:hypothetical protein